MRWESLEQLDGVKAALQNALKKNALSHFLIFIGPDGGGKTTAAKILTQRLLCERPDMENPCEKCPSCKQFSSGNHPDYTCVAREAGKKEMTVNLSAQIMQAMSLKTARHGWRVIHIVDGGDMNVELSNALLKLLEEPFEKTLILLEAAGRAKLLPTILSRGQTLSFTPVSDATLRKFIIDDSLSGPERDWIVEQSRGSVGRAREIVLNKRWREVMALHGSLQGISRVPTTETAGKLLALAEADSETETRANLAALLDGVILDWRRELRSAARAGASANNLLSRLRLAVEMQEYLHHNGNTALAADYFCAALSEKT